VSAACRGLTDPTGRYIDYNVFRGRKKTLTYVEEAAVCSVSAVLCPPLTTQATLCVACDRYGPRVGLVYLPPPRPPGRAKASAQRICITHYMGHRRTLLALLALCALSTTVDAISHGKDASKLKTAKASKAAEAVPSYSFVERLHFGVAGLEVLFMLEAHLSIRVACFHAFDESVRRLIPISLEPPPFVLVRPRPRDVDALHERLSSRANDGPLRSTPDLIAPSALQLLTTG
jgi:hypothetical protein